LAHSAVVAWVAALAELPAAGLPVARLADLAERAGPAVIMNIGQLVLLARPECGLCAEMHAAIEALRPTHMLPPLEIVDVDTDPTLQRRYGLRIPVLLLDGATVCEHRLDVAELLRLMRR
jgi:hypothetical protein